MPVRLCRQLKIIQVGIFMSRTFLPPTPYTQVCTTRNYLGTTSLQKQKKAFHVVLLCHNKATKNTNLVFFLSLSRSPLVNFMLPCSLTSDIEQSASDSLLQARTLFFFKLQHFPLINSLRSHVSNQNTCMFVATISAAEVLQKSTCYQHTGLGAALLHRTTACQKQQEVTNCL